MFPFGIGRRTLKHRVKAHGNVVITLTMSSPLSSGSINDLVSGGVDTNLILSSEAFKFDRVKQRRLSSWPHRPVMSRVAQSKSILEQRDNGVRIWSVGCGMYLCCFSGLTSISLAQLTPEEANDAQTQDKDRLSILENGKMVAELNVKMKTNVTGSALSADGKWVAISDAHQVKLFRISVGQNGIRISKSHEFEAQEIPCGANTMKFTPDSSKLVIASLDSVIRVVSMQDFSIMASLRMHYGEHENTGKRTRALINLIYIQ